MAKVQAELNKLKPARTRHGWLFLWLAWTISTTFGWLLTWLLTVVMAFAFVIPDLDAARIYRSKSVWERMSEPLVLGAMTGLIPGVVIGLLLWVVLRRRPREVVWAVLATIGGSALLCVVGSAGGPQVESACVSTLRLGILGGAIGGGFTGLCQWIILRRNVSQVNGWIGLTVPGWIIGWTMALWATGLFEQLSRAMDPGWATGSMKLGTLNLILLVAALFAGGTLVGLGQWLLLRRHVKRAGWWILATAVGWSITAGVGVGVITGTTLVWLLRSAPHSPPPEAA